MSTVTVDNGSGTDYTVSLNTGTVDDSTQRVTLATDVALPAGTNAIGKLSANSGVDIGDVDDPVSQAKLDTIITLLGSTVATQVWKSFATTSTATGHAMWIPTASKKIAITHLSIGTAGNVAGKVTLWFGAAADTTYTAGTDQPAIIASFAPSSIASTYPGAILQPASPILAANADYSLRVTTDNSMTMDIVAYGYEF